MLNLRKFLGKPVRWSVPLILSWLTCDYLALSKPNDQLSLSLPKYVNIYLRSSPLLKRQEMENTKQNLNLRATQSHWSNELKLTPQASHMNIDVTPGGYTDRQKNTVFSTEFRQSLPFGMSLGLSGGYSWQLSQQEQNSNPTEFYSLTWNQDLWKNWLGAEERLLEETAVADLKLSDMELQQTFGMECIKSAKQYIELYTTADIQKLYRKNMEDSETIYRRYQDLYRQKLVKKTEFLTAESDWIANQKSLVTQTTQFKNSQIQALLPLGLESADYEMADPESLLRLDEIEAHSVDWNQLSAIRIFDYEIAGKESQLALSREKSKSTVSLSVEAGRRKSQQIIDVGVLATRQEYIEVGVSASLPLHNPVSSYDIKKSGTDVAISRENQREALLQTKVKWQQLKTEIAALSSEINLTEKRIDILEQKLQEAQDEVRRLQMELFDYIRHRSDLISSQIARIEIRRQLWEKLLDFWFLNDKLPSFCKVPS